MYDRDMPLIKAHALASPDGLVDLGVFCISTIRQPFQQMKVQMDDYRANGVNAKMLFGHKRAGVEYLIEHKRVLHAAIVEAVKCGDAVAAIDVLTNVPGLGIVKAAFVAQCCGLEVACLDSHNLTRLGLPVDSLKMAKGLKRETRLAKIAKYVALCRETGGSRYWWDSWCEYVAGRRNSPLKTGDEVSAFHVTALNLA
jgi:hypothetical protein